MDANALALLQQLAANPEMVGQMQSMLTLLGSQSHSQQPGHSAAALTTTSSSPVATLTGAATTATRQPHSRPPPHSYQSVAPTSGEIAARAPRAKTLETRRSSRASDAVVTGRLPSVTNARVRERVETLEQQLQEGKEIVKDHERKARQAAQRVTAIEQELHSAMQRVDHLSTIVSDQRRQLDANNKRHQLDLEEMKHSYELAMQRKDTIHEEAMRQVLRSQQLMSTALRFQEKVQTGRLSARDGAVNVPPPTAPHGTVSSLKGGRSTVKRERAIDDDDEDAEQPPYRPPHRSAEASLTTRSETQWKERSEYVLKEETVDAAAVAAPSSAQRRTAGKASTVLTGRAMVSSRSHKRRTPRTPSLTNADRISASTSPAPPPLTSSSFSKRLPAGAQDLSPATAVWSAQQSHKRSGPASKEIDLHSGTVSPVPIALAAKQQQLQLQLQQQQDNEALGRFVNNYSSTHAVNAGRAVPMGAGAPPRPLPTKVAGRLPQQQQQPHPDAGIVPSVRSGASSVVPGPTRSPSPVNPKRGPALPRRFLLTGLTDNEPARLRATIAGIGQDSALLVSDFDEPPPHSVTHIIVRGTPRSVKALCGVVAGKWLVAPDYVYNSQQAGFWLDEMDEGGLRIFPPPLKCQRFLLTVEHPDIRAKLAQVIEYGGGEVVRPGVESSGVQWTEQGVIVITSGDDLLRYATQQQQL